MSIRLETDAERRKRQLHWARQLGYREACANAFSDSDWLQLEFANRCSADCYFAAELLDAYWEGVETWQESYDLTREQNIGAMGV